MQYTILLLEDDMALAMGIEYALKGEGYNVVHAATIKQARAWLDNNTNLCNKGIAALFDVMLPDGNSFDLLKEYRRKGISIPIIFLTAISDEINVVQGLDLGADDYIAKPFRVRELISRLKAVLRRYEVNADSIITYGDLVVDMNTAKVYKKTDKDESVYLDLTAGEYKMLLYFLQNQGVILSRNLILEHLFDNNGNFIDDNTLSVYIKRLREKLGDTDKKHPYIKTVRGIGYIMEKENAY